MRDRKNAQAYEVAIESIAFIMLSMLSITGSQRVLLLDPVGGAVDGSVAQRQSHYLVTR
jgi:hypothetical protein